MAIVPFLFEANLFKKRRKNFLVRINSGLEDEKFSDKSMNNFQN